MAYLRIVWHPLNFHEVRPAGQVSGLGHDWARFVKKMTLNTFFDGWKWLPRARPFDLFNPRPIFLCRRSINVVFPAREKRCGWWVGICNPIEFSHEFDFNHIEFIQSFNPGRLSMQFYIPISSLNLWFWFHASWTEKNTERRYQDEGTSHCHVSRFQ